jgi:hypothetical protein
MDWRESAGVEDEVKGLGVWEVGAGVGGFGRWEEVETPASFSKTCRTKMPYVAVAAWVLLDDV